MTAQQNKQFILEYFQVMRKDPSPENVERYVDDPILKEHIYVFVLAMPGYYFEIEHIIAEGDIVACHVMVYGKHTGPLFGIPPSGSDIAVPANIHYQVANKKIVKFWAFMDMRLLMEQIRAVPEMPIRK